MTRLRLLFTAALAAGLAATALADPSQNGDNNAATPNVNAQDHANTSEGAAPWKQNAGGQPGAEQTPSGTPDSKPGQRHPGRRRARNGRREVRQGDRREDRGERMERQGERMEKRADRLDANGHEKAADKVDAAGERHEDRGERMERQGDRREDRGERHERQGRRMQRRGGRGMGMRMGGRRR